jgi:hypothetical protein
MRESRLGTVMKLWSLQVIAFSVSAMAACSPGGQPPAVAGTPFLPCHTSDLEMQLIKVGAAAGNIGATIEVRNQSQRDCDLYGYALLQLEDAAGRPLPTHVIWSISSFFLQSPASEEVVALPAGTPAITSDRPVPGHAYIPLSWNDVQAPCSEASLLRMTPPDSDTSLVINAGTAGSPGTLEVCSDGTVFVNPTRAAESP